VIISFGEMKLSKHLTNYIVHEK